MNPEVSSNDRLVDRLGRNATLGAIGDSVQPILRDWLDGSGGVKTPLKDILHGTWLGHSLHPAITDIPVGAFSVTAIADLLTLAGADASAAADFALGVGLIGSLGAIVTGFAEWSDTKGEPKNIGVAHALANAAGFTLYLGSYALRRAKKRGAAVALSMTAYAFSGAAAFLGGELSYNLGIGMKHTAPVIDPPPDYVAVLDDAALEERKPMRVDLAGIPVLLVRSSGNIHAISAVCTHRGAPLETGSLEGECIRCPWHGSIFALADGSVVEGPATAPEARFDVRVTAGKIELRAIA